MQCPACLADASETARACPRCGFSLQASDKHFGAVPRLRAGLSDLSGALSRSEAKRLERLLARFSRSFPQTNPNIALLEVDPSVPLRPYTFWLFNRAGISSQMSKGSANRTILLLIDTLGVRSTLMIGYGLEPFLGTSLLDRCLLAGANALRARKWADAASRILDTLATEAATVCEAMPRTYGIDLAECLQYDNTWRTHRQTREGGLY